MNMNVFKCGYMPWRRPINWGYNIKHFFHTFKDGWQRATRGYADSDVWNLSSYLLAIMSDTLEALANNHWGWPCDDNFPEDDDWTNFLLDMSEKFYRADEDNDCYPTPMRDKWWEWSLAHWSNNFNTASEEKPYVDAMIAEDYENNEKRMRDFAEAWSAIGEQFFHLWD